MQTRCPHCHVPISVVDEDSLADLTCDSCGSHFSLVSDDETIKHSEYPECVAHFDLVDRVGTGAVGTVWKARDTKLDRTVALKIPRKGQLSASETEQFLREAQAAAQVNHPNIVAVHEVGRDDETVFIVSEYIDGANLAEWLSAERLTPREAAELCRSLAMALDVAHRAGVVHRDLKPANILLDRNAEPHIADFGLAKRELGDLTMTLDGRILGTPAYMSPEQARGEGNQADGRADVYSLGAILYELLAGEPPFRGEVRMLLTQILEREPASPRSLNSRVPRDLETICMKCLEKEADARYDSAGELAEDLGRFLQDQPIAAKPVGSLGRALRWCRRKPLIAALSGTLATMVLAVAIVSPIVAAQQATLRQQAVDLVADKDELLKEKEALVDQLNDALAEQRAATEKAQQLAEENMIISNYVEDTFGVAKKWILRGAATVEPLLREDDKLPKDDGDEGASKPSQ